MKSTILKLALFVAVVAGGIPLTCGNVVAQTRQPNILVIMGDDIGYWNISRNNDGMMGYQTPNIDRLAREGMRFTDYYAEQSCTAGRAAFITGQMPIRTGLTKVGTPGSDVGIQPEDPTLAELLKPLGYATGQFGKNHLGDKDEFLPTNHGFDEFYGNLYHLNAEEEPENVDYPKSPAYRKKHGPRGVLRSFADGRIEDTGPLTRKRMETVDDEFLTAAEDFIERNTKAGNPWFTWFNSTRMHYYTHVRPENQGKSGQDFYADGMLEHDDQVGQLLNLLDELKVADNTIVIYTTDNGPHFNQWPDGGITPFRSEKNTNWEGGYRVPCFVRWPGHIEANSVSNEITSHQDWVPTLMAAVGVPGIKEKLKAGYSAGEKMFKVHLDGYDLLPYLTGREKKSPRRDFAYFNDDGLLVNIRVEDWKFVFYEQRAKKFDLWREPFVELRIPKIFNLRRDPFERADTDSNLYNRWWDERLGIASMATDVVERDLPSFVEFPPRQKPDSFNLDRVLKKSKETAGK